MGYHMSVVLYCSYERKQAIREASIRANKAHLVLAPTENEILSGYRSVIVGFESTVGKT